MTVRLKKQRNGTFRKHWYGSYEDNGKRTEINLNVPWRGLPPEAALPGDPRLRAFERSRDEAETALALHVEEARHKGRAAHLTERLIESKTGHRVTYTRIGDLSARWRTLGRENPASERYLAACDATFNRFVGFMQEANASARCLYEVTPENASAFLSEIQGTFSRKSTRDAVKLLNKAFSRFLPIGVANPFAAFIGRRSSGATETVHRKPFTPDELKAILTTAESDPFMFPLIITAACTGMRRGDVCRLRWSAVDWAAGMLAVKTSKTDVDVEIPIFGPLRAVLEKHKHDARDRDYVFPEAARMLEENPDGLTWRFKKIVARALERSMLPRPRSATGPEIEEEGQCAIRERIRDTRRRERMLEVFRRYCAGESLRQIVATTGYCKATVSNDLHAVQEMIGKNFMRVQPPSLKSAVRRTTQVEREHGQRIASVRDWHALRVTWVTLALARGVPVEVVRRVTGHVTVEVILKHYFKPDREQFRAVLSSGLPDVLTGAKAKEIAATPIDELASLVAKIQNDTATEAERRRFRVLAVKV